MLIQNNCSLFIIVYSLLCIMLGTIELNNKPGFMAVKISNIVVYRLLPLKPNRITAKKIKPKMIFLRCCGFSEIFGERNQFLIIFYGQNTLL